MKTLKIDDKWSVEYDERQNDRPVRLLRHGVGAVKPLDYWTNDDVHAMFYALLAHEEAAADTRRLTRELDVAMHGEAGAAEQASLCDLITAAKALRANTLESLMKDANPLIMVDTWPQKTLRDEFATAALPWCLKNIGCDTPFGFIGNDAHEVSYRIADAMLKAREGK